MIKKTIVTALTLGIGFYLVFWLMQGPQSIHGEMAPPIEATLLDGSQFKLEELQNQYVLLDFWGSWCPPCRRENPKLVDFYKEYHGHKYTDAEDVEIVTIALEKRKGSSSKVAQKEGFMWKFQIEDVSRIVLASSLARAYNVSNVPTKFLIGPSGEIVLAEASFEEVKAFLDKKKQ